MVHLIRFFLLLKIWAQETNYGYYDFQSVKGALLNTFHICIWLVPIFIIIHLSCANYIHVHAGS